MRANTSSGAMLTLHVTNGDHVAMGLARSGLPGDVLAWRDVLHDGPVPPDADRARFWQARADFLAERQWASELEVIEDLAARDARLDELGPTDAVVLWFEPDVYDQLQLMQVLSRLASRDAESRPATWIAPADLLLGSLSPEKFRPLYEARRVVTVMDLAHGRESWDAFTSPSPDALLALVDRLDGDITGRTYHADEAVRLPHLTAALRRILEEYPDTDTGLSRSERQICEALMPGKMTLGKLFQASHRASESWAWLGDSSFAWYVQRLSDAEQPLVSHADGTRVLAPPPATEIRDFWQRAVALTPFGAEVVRARADAVHVNGIDRSIGGARLTTERHWRWDARVRATVPCGAAKGTRVERSRLTAFGGAASGAAVVDCAMSPDALGATAADHPSDVEALLAQLDADLEADTTLAAAEPLLALAANYLTETRLGEGPVSTWHSAQTIADRLEVEMPRRGRPLAAVAKRLAALLLEDVNRLAHPMYIGHQVSAPLPAAVWTDALISAYNQSLAVREMSPSFTPLEHQVVAWMTDVVGWDEHAGGTMTSGGTEATLTALLAARSRVLPDVWTRGMPSPAPVLVCGEHAHYAVMRAAGVMGLGTANVVTIPSQAYRMDVGALRESLQRLRDEHATVMAVVATAGCTATGSFDDLPAIADACTEYADEHGDLWLHVDAAHGGAAMLSSSHRHRVAGIERARSIAWDPHKTLLLPLAAGLLLMRDERELSTAFAQKAPYLFTAQDDARAWDTGPRSFLCSRRADVLKVYVAFERYGADALAALYDRLCRVTRAVHDRLAATAEFVPLHQPESNILCFAWTPSGMPASRMDDLTDLLRERYNRSGRGFITSTTLNGRRVLRVTVMNARTNETHAEKLVEGLEAEGRAVLKHND